ncbi:hypothetical protein B0F90DRAFT_1817130 [Multifurca ochricompacta]|uniref:Uncharacterized protein n=1 Tax=Multifurca ochricompacta TaxID=376703 RepID=A0AAD4QNK2_9AGAM|nr:hypothetical protein B0F90DRAFT_1817130 [Multifurca ochricompacta]
MSNSITLSASFTDPTKGERREHMRRGLTNAPVSAPTTQSQPAVSTSTTPTRPRAESRQHAPTKSKARPKYDSEWTAYGDLEPSGCPPWFV